MKEENKTAKAITLLLQQTQDGFLRWEAHTPGEDLTQGTARLVETVYFAEKEQQTLRLYSYRDRFYTDEEVWHWEDGVALELSDKKGISWWQFPGHPIIWDLLEAVRFKTAGADAFIDKLLEEGEAPSEPGPTGG